MKVCIPATAAVVLLAACAHLPDVAVGYYLAQSKVGFKVVRTVACDKSDRPIVATAVTPEVAHSADRNRPATINLSGLKGPFSDSDLKFDFYDDGRLKDVNATSTGQGEAILKTVVTIAAAAFVGFDARGRAIAPTTYSAECAIIRNAAGDRALTLTYQGEIDVRGPGGAQNIPADTMNSYYASALHGAIGTVCAQVTRVEKPVSPASVAQADASSNPTQSILLRAQQPGWAEIKVMAGPANQCTGKAWDGRVEVAQAGVSYDIPIPKAVAFGKEVFAASFAESGALTSLQYTTNTGTGQVLNVVSSGLSAAQGITAQKADQVKAEADLIAQMERLVQCKATPESCQ